MKIVFAASECVPFAKTGGLADVVGALGPEMVKLGHEVTVYLPLYARVRPHIEGELKYVAQSITIPFEYYNRFVGIVDGGTRDGVKYYFVDCPELFDRQELYGTRTGDYPDNAERFGLFCRAVVEATKLLGVPDVFHVHDWQAAMVPVYLRAVYSGDPMLRGAAVVLTIHNAGYQGDVSAGDDGEAVTSVGDFHHGQAGAVRPVQFFEGRAGLFRHLDHGEPQVCRGDSDGGVRRGTGHCAAWTGGGPTRDFERRGLRQVGSEDGRKSGGALYSV